MKKILALFLVILFGLNTYAQKNRLQHEFVAPPEEVKTSVYWYWMCGNISKEGVVKDLQEMKKVGINRVFIGHNYFDPYAGGRNVKLMSDEWWEVLHTAVKTAGELDIEVGMFNSPGWTQAGGPWVKPEESMRYLNSSEIQVKGPQKLSTKLEKPHPDFQDVKLIAYPVNDTGESVLNTTNARIAVSPAIEQSDKMFDGDRLSDIRLPQNVDYCIDMKTDKDFTARSLTIYPSHCNINATFELQAKIGNEYRTLSNFVIDWHFLANIVGFQPFAPVVMTIDETNATDFRLLVKNRHHEGGIAEVELSSTPRIESYAAKTFAKMFQGPLPQWDYYTWREQPEVTDVSLNIDPAKVVDISDHMAPDGTVTWDVPAGNWVIVRTGMTSTGVTNNPGGPDGTGLETDKLSKKHLASHFDAFIGKIMERIPAEDRKAFKVVIQDSYESGGQNFTDDFLERFKERYGYDALPFLPAYFGKVVGSKEQSDRFLWDMRRIVADRIAYDYVGGLRELCHKHGMTTWLENYGHWGFPAEFLQYGGQSDEVGGEYWLPNAFPSWENDLGNIENRAASSCAHIYGKPLVSAESNTSGGPAFSRVPADAKQRTDKYFSEGINNTLLHVYIHQPDTNRYPGTNAWFGTEFNRANTWYSHIDLFLNYVKRCNYMLRQGLNVADIAYFISEDVPKMTGIQDPSLPAGCQFDYINAEVLLRDAFVKNGMITLPHGTSYKVLSLPQTKSMRPELLLKIKQLVQDGAIILGAAPMHSPSLENQPEADRLVASAAAELWGNVDGVQATSRRYGKGMVFNGVSLEELFATIGWTVDCKSENDAPILFGHRTAKNNTDIYFLSNQSEERQKTIMQFRVKGMQPELWNPMHGTIRPLNEFSVNGGLTSVPVTLEGFESAFIVFRKKGKPVKGATNFSDPVESIVIDSPWDVSFKSPLAVPNPIRLPKLQDLSLMSDPKIKYFSGNMIYTTTIDVDLSRMAKRTVELNLGKVAKMAKVWINDRYVGGVWSSPYSLDISSALKQGKNTIRIDVVNTWVNRLIGNSIYPEMAKETWVGMSPYNRDSPLQESGLIGPVKLDLK
ncbi:glycosyl hydrolase [Bacteroides sp.]|uniref:glycosyl hydrolase n=1 Tax=Bacteroides sp. TaxID=29523 RepID=UPI00262EEB77|nr:glycosyl hydrolase [Bacteroides sp.]MDD3038343.1 glycosyl hydrolase [Bacteroides sp.]